MQYSTYILDYVVEKLYSYGYESYWLDRYVKFLEWRIKSRVLTKDDYYEVHHIVPRSWCEEMISDDNNLVKLTYREHIIAHHLLMKTGDPSMGTALNVMLGRGDYYEGLKIEIRAWMLRLQEQAAIVHQYNVSKPVIDLQTGIQYKSGLYADRVFGLREGSVARGIYGKGKVGGTFWMLVEDLTKPYQEHLQDILDERKLRKQNVVNANAKEIMNLTTGQIFKSASEAARICGVVPDSMTSAIRVMTKCCGDYWMYVEDMTMSKEDEIKRIESCIQNKNNQTSYDLYGVYDLTTKTQYLSARDACLKVFGSKGFSNSLLYNIKTKRPYKGHYFIFLKDKEENDQLQLGKMINEYETTIKYKKTESFSIPIINLTTHKKYHSCNEAKKEYNDTTDAILRALDNKKETFGCYWIREKDYDSSKTYEQVIDEIKETKQRQLKEAYFNRTKHFRDQGVKIIELLTDKVYESISVASKTLGICAKSIKDALYCGKFSDHYTFDEKYCFVIYDEYIKMNDVNKQCCLEKDFKRFESDIINLTDNIVFRTRTEASKCYNIGEGQITKACNSIATCRKRFWCYRKDLIDNNIQKTLEFKQNQYIEKFGSLLI